MGGVLGGFATTRGRRAVLAITAVAVERGWDLGSAVVASRSAAYVNAVTPARAATG